MKQLRIFFLCLVAATLVTACGGDDKDNSTPVEKITLDKDKLTFVAQWKMRPSHFPEGGFTVVKGDGYTLTQLDLEKITSQQARGACHNKLGKRTTASCGNTP